MAVGIIHTRLVRTRGVRYLRGYAVKGWVTLSEVGSSSGKVSGLRVGYWGG